MKGRAIEQHVLEQIDLAIHALETLEPEGAVHEARKACKRARAALQLAPGTRALGKRIRDAARVIGDIRDAHVLAHTLREFGMADEAPQLDDAETRRCIRKAHKRLKKARKAVERSELRKVKPKPIAKRYAKTWRRARRAADAVRRDADGEVVHEWRKAIKQLYYQASLLDAPLTVIHRADALQDVLGHHHDLCVAAARVPDQAEGLRARADRVLEDALEQGERLLRQ